MVVLFSVLGAGGLAIVMWLTISRTLREILQPKSEHAPNKNSWLDQLSALELNPAVLSPAEAAALLANAIPDTAASLEEKEAFEKTRLRTAKVVGIYLCDKLEDVANKLMTQWKLLLAYLFVAALIVGAWRLASLGALVPLELLIASWWDVVIVGGPAQATTVALCVLLGTFLAFAGWGCLWLVLRFGSLKSTIFAADQLRPAWLALVTVVVLLLPGLGIAYLVNKEPTSTQSKNVRTIQFGDAQLSGVVEAVSSKFLVFRPVQCPGKVSQAGETSAESKASDKSDQVQLLALARVSAIASPCSVPPADGATAAAPVTSVISVTPMAGSDEDFARVVLGCDLWAAPRLGPPPTANFPADASRLDQMEAEDRASLEQQLQEWTEALHGEDLSSLRIAIVGFASPSGPAAYNLDLATRRAQSLKVEFESLASTRDLKIASADVRVVGLGETVPYKRFLDDEHRQQSATAFICRISPAANESHER